MFNSTIKTKELKKAGIYYLFGTFFNKGIAFITVPIFTRLLNTDDYGIISTYSSWTGIVTILMCCTLYMGVRAAFIDYEEKIEEFLSTMLLFQTSIFVLVLGIFTFSSCFYKFDIWLPLFCIIQSYAAGIIEDYIMYLMMKYKYKQRTAFMVLPGLISTILAFVAIKYFLMTNLYLGRIIPNVVVTFIIALFVLIIVFKKSFVFKKEYLKYGLTISLPIILHGISLSILSASDRIMITWLVDSSSTGIYSLIYNFGTIALVITSTLDGVWIPWFTDQMKQHSKQALDKINIAAKYYVFIIGIVMSLIILCGPEILKFLAPEKYWSGISIIPPIVFATYIQFIYSFYVNIEHFHKKTASIASNTLISAISNVILNFIFIPIYGYEAAAYTTTASYFVSMILHYNASKKLEPQIFPLQNFSFVATIFAIAIFVFYFHLDNLIIRWIVAIISIIPIAYAYKKFVRIKNHT